MTGPARQYALLPLDYAIQEAVAFLRLHEPPEGYFVGFSGGWDISEGAHGTIHREGRGAPAYRPRQNASFSAAVNGLVEMRNKRTVWTIPAARFAEAHFATFPPALVEPCIKAGCPRDGIVLDPFFGAGTTGLVARRLGRQFLGIELSPKYCRMAAQRIQAETGLFGPVEIVRHLSGDEVRFSAAAGGME